jgi:hypothetical protein
MQGSDEKYFPSIEARSGTAAAFESQEWLDFVADKSPDFSNKGIDRNFKSR